MDDTFNSGDVVQLKSGGPIMTVEEANFTEVWAVWFAYGKQQRSRFRADALQRAEVLFEF